MDNRLITEYRPRFCDEEWSLVMTLVFIGWRPDTRFTSLFLDAPESPEADNKGMYVACRPHRANPLIGNGWEFRNKIVPPRALVWVFSNYSVDKWDVVIVRILTRYEYAKKRGRSKAAIRTALPNGLPQRTKQETAREPL